jgi:hypothetical protein
MSEKHQIKKYHILELPLFIRESLNLLPFELTNIQLVVESLPV